MYVLMWTEGSGVLIQKGRKADEAMGQTKQTNKQTKSFKVSLLYQTRKLLLP